MGAAADWGEGRMPDKFFLSASGSEAAGSLHNAAERVLWSGHCAVAEYAFDEPASLPRWTLPEETEVVVTDQRVLYRDPATLGTGELTWRWPQHLRVQPGNRETGRNATVTQIQLVCGGPNETFPALVFAGGEVTTIGDADRLANTLRQAIARYRVEHAVDLGIAAPQARMLSRLVIGPEFSNYQGGEGQTVSLLGATQVQQAYSPARGHAAPDYPTAEQPYAGSAYDATPYSAVPASPAVAPEPAPAPGYARWESDEPHRHPEPAPPQAWDGQPPVDLDSRAADLAARVAMLVSGGSEPDRYGTSYEQETHNLSAYLGAAQAPTGGFDPQPAELDGLSRAESVRRTAARLAGNAARGRSTLPPPARRADDETGATTRGGHRR
jgi:hypothetical protein